MYVSVRIVDVGLTHYDEASSPTHNIIKASPHHRDNTAKNHFAIISPYILVGGRFEYDVTTV